MKKIFYFIRGIVIFTVWSIVFSLFSNFLINLIWRFDFMSAHSWNILSSFWNQGGVIKTASDILLISSLFLLPFLWLIGYILVLKLDYIKIFLAPINWVSSIFNSNTKPERIIIKNLKSNSQFIEDIKNEIDSLKPQEAKRARDIRSEITQKLSKESKK